MYIFWFLHQTTTIFVPLKKYCMLYIFWFLHQTTTYAENTPCYLCCISFDSYIKPQLYDILIFYDNVVYLLIPTSNHNIILVLINISVLYIFWFLHQTTTAIIALNSSGSLYIFWFLHQTTTAWSLSNSANALYIFWFLHQTTTLILILILVNLLYIFWFLHQTTTFLMLLL